MQLILSFDNEEDFELAKAALEKRIPGKPVYYDTKFRQCGPQYGELVTLERAYDCPCCKRTYGICILNISLILRNLRVLRQHLYFTSLQYTF